MAGGKNGRLAFYSFTIVIYLPKPLVHCQRLCYLFSSLICILISLVSVDE